jgi:hypothetical protein
MAFLKRLLDGTTGLVRTCFMGVSGTNYKLLFRFLPDWHPQLKEYTYRSLKFGQGSKNLAGSRHEHTPCHPHGTS